MPSASAKDTSAFAWEGSSGVKSTPVTLAPPILLAVMAVLPVPHDTSSTLSLGETLYSRTNWAETGRIKGKVM
jgi:hypothetical protein